MISHCNCYSALYRDLSFKQQNFGLQMRANKIIFMHAEKTGGSTIFAALKGLFDADQICPERHEQIALLPKEYLNRFSFFSAHATTEELKDIPRPAFLMTFLRDPVERSLSLYDYWRSFSWEFIENNNLYGPRLAKMLTPIQFFDCSNNWRTHATNRYTEMLTGGSKERSGEHILKDVEHKSEQAILALETFDFVGITELMDDSFERLSQCLDIPKNLLSEQENVSHENSRINPTAFDPIENIDIDDETLDQITSLNASDKIIYDHFIMKYTGSNSYEQTVNLIPYENTRIRRGREANWHSNMHGGFVLIGPYMRLRPGTYESSIHFNNSGLLEKPHTIEIDVVANKAKSIFFKEKILLNKELQDRHVIRFLIPHAVNDLEIRIKDESGGIECNNIVKLRRFT